MMHTTLIVGLGGTGCDVIRELREKVVEVYGSLEAEEIKDMLGFLYIDTDSKEIESVIDTRMSTGEQTHEKNSQEQRWEVLGHSIRLNPDECVIINASEIDRIMGDIESVPYFSEWFPLEQLKAINSTSKDTAGARQIRPLGRFVFTWKINEIKQAFLRKLGSLKTPPGRGQTYIYVISSLSGGTGSGMFLDLTNAIEEWRPGNSFVKTGFLVMPSMATLRGDRYLVNAYASLQELNYFNIRDHEFILPQSNEPIKRSPFDLCYLVGTENEKDIQLDLNALPSMIAHRIFLEFDTSDSSVAASVKGRLNSGALNRDIDLIDPFNGNKHSQNFSTFGLSTIQFPFDQVIELTSQRLVALMFEHWMKENIEAPKNIAEQSREIAGMVRLTDDFLLGDKDFFGDQHNDNYQNEVKNFINTLNGKLSAAPNNFLAPGQQAIEDFESTFRNKGILPYYQELQKDTERIAKVIMSEVEKRISQLVVDYGFDYAGKIVEQVMLDLSERKAGYLEAKGACDKKALNTQKRSLPIFEKELNEAEFSMIFKKKKKKEAITNYLEVVKAHAENKIGGQAYALADSITELVLNKLEELMTRMKDCIIVIENMLAEFEEESNRWETFFKQKNENEREFNGSIIFTTEKISQAVKELDVEAAIQHLQKIAIEKTGRILRIHEVKSVGFREDLRRAASQWVNEVNTVKVFDTDVVQELLAKYPGADRRKQLIMENANKAMPFMKFDQVEVAKANGKQELGGWKRPDASWARAVGLIGDDGGKNEDVVKIKTEIRQAANMDPNNIVAVEKRNKNEIVFLEEQTAFPLRVLKGVGILKKKYEEYITGPDYIPVHLQQNYNPPLMSLFLTDEKTKQMIEDAKEVFVLARIMDVIRIGENLREERSEIQYCFKEYGIEKHLSLGWSWEDAYDSFTMNIEVSQACQEEVNKKMEGLKSRGERKILGERLQVFLEEIKTDCKMGEDDPIYRRYQRIIHRIIEKYRL